MILGRRIYLFSLTLLLLLGAGLPVRGQVHSVIEWPFFLTESHPVPGHVFETQALGNGQLIIKVIETS